MGNNQIEITRWPVLLYANYRTGSNVLGSELAIKYKAKWYPEPIRNAERYKNFIEHYHSDDTRYIVKFMPDQTNQIVETAELFNSDCFKIKLTRKNEFDQIVSHYIASMRDQWVQSSPSVSNYSVDLDYTVLENVIQVIQSNNRLLDEEDNKFDVSLCYEDLNFTDNSTLLHKITPPDNIELLRKIIRRYYEQR